MSLIGIEGIKVKAPIGIYQHEKENGCSFLVDVILETDINFEEIQDDINKTINYELVSNLVKERMSRSYNLIETVLVEIYHRIIENYPDLKSVKIRVKKLNPLGDETVSSAFVESVFVR